MSLATLTALAEAAVAALEQEDYALAIRKALACKPLLAVTPELSRGSQGDSQSMAFRSPSAIDSFVSECRKMQSAKQAQTQGVFGLAKTRFGRSDNSVDSY
jgi:hypothetical protein